MATINGNDFSFTQSSQLNLAELDGSNGFTLQGIDQYDRSGRFVSNAGDVNGDGFDDLLIGAPFANPSGLYYAGESYVVFGSGEGFAANFNLAELNGSNGFVINSINQVDSSGSSVSAAGDVNGDGFDDLLIGAENANPSRQTYSLYSAGESYVVFGSGEGFEASFNLAELNGSNGFVINGIDEGGRLGTSISTAGDVNGDGFDDLLIGAPRADPNGQDYAGQSYVVFGKQEDFTASFNLAELNGSNGFVINGIDEGDDSGASVSTAGDINGDGFDDLIVGAFVADANGQEDAGESYVVFGKQEGFAASLDLAELNGSNGFAIQGIDKDDSLGLSVSNAGDINGDGFDDLIIGAPFANSNGQYFAGESYVVFGSGASFEASLDLAELNGNNGFVINGIDEGDDSGRSVSNAGDVNGDGFDDLVVGASGADPNSQEAAGESYVVFGRQEGFAATLDLAELNGGNGFVINGIDEGDSSGRSVSNAGDVNGDDFDDLLIGAPGADPNGQYNAGESYVVFGSDFPNRSNGSDIIRGHQGDETFTGGGSQDTFVIGEDGGTDTITDFGGIGTDVIPTEAEIAEVDTLKFEGAGLSAENLLLTQERNNLLITFAGVEGTQVLLQDFALENLDNLQQSTGAAVDLGSILFDGQSQIEDSFDVFNADQQRLSVFNLNTVTFLNELDNTTEGHNGSSDVINAQGGNDYITGLTGNDLLRGGAGDDSLDGGGSAIREVDTLTGGAGADRFILGNPTAALYDDGDLATVGTSDYALITDFNSSEDVIQLHGQQSDYRLSAAFSSLPAGTAIFRDKPGEEPDELISVVQGSSQLSLDSSNFSFTPSFEFNLAELDGSNGFAIQGIDQYDFSGYSVSDAGDVNGDGFDDLLIGAPAASPAGESYVVFGSGEGFTASFNLAELDGSNGFVLNGVEERDRSGYSVSTAGDVNGDGFDDLLIGAPAADPSGLYDAGESYVVFGKQEGFAASLDLVELDGSNGFIINGTDEFDVVGGSVSTAGDVNGDGFDDLLIGASGADPNGQYYAGESYVVFGKQEGFTASFNLAELDGSNGFVLNGIEERDRSGASVNTAGDVNGDGFDDLVVGAASAGPNGQYYAGESYVVFGKQEGFTVSFNLAELNGSNGFVLNGIDEGDGLGRSVSTAGDVNGDGFDDLVVGALGADPNGQEAAGESYVVFGSGAGFEASLDLAELDGSNGFVINGIDEFDLSGRSVSTAGDVNGDGFDDLIVGAYRADPNGQYSIGQSYVVFGSGEGFDASLDLAELNGNNEFASNGFVLNGIDEGDGLGRSVSTAGDVNGDGFDDLLIGAAAADPNGQYASGESHVVFGRDFTGQNSRPDALGNDGLNNTASNDILSLGQLSLATGLAGGTSITF